MIRAYSKRISPPFSGTVQIAETEAARAMSMDGLTWEFYQILRFTNPMGLAEKQSRPVAIIQSREFAALANDESPAAENLPPPIRYLVEFLATASLPFAAADHFEYWLLDQSHGEPLAMIFSCTTASEMEKLPERAEWNSLPAIAMKIEPTAAEQEQGLPPVNHRVERLVAEHAGYYAKAQWFERRYDDSEDFPSLMLREDWGSEQETDLCRRYIERKASRLLLLHHLSTSVRERLEQAARQQALETERFNACYPTVIDQKLMNSIRVEAQLRRHAEEPQREVPGIRFL